MYIYSEEQLIFDECMFSHGWWLTLALTLDRCIVPGSVQSAGEESALSLCRHTPRTTLHRSRWLCGRFRRCVHHNINQRWLFCAVFYSSCTASLSLSMESQLNKNRQTVKKVLKVKKFPFFRWSHRSWDKYMMADIQRIKGFQYVDANQSFSGTFFLLLRVNVILLHVRHFLACGSGNVVLILDLSSCGSWPSFLHYPASLKTPKPMRPQPKLVDLLCATCHLIQIGPVRQCRAWCHGVIFITRAPHERWNSNSGSDEGLMVVNGHWPLQPTLLLQGAAQSRWCCYFQGQKRLNNSSDFIITDQIMWCDML